MSAQQQVHANVAARGYLDGYTYDQITGRQVVKLIEELGELSSEWAMTFSNSLTTQAEHHRLNADLNELGERARRLFDGDWRFVIARFDAESLASEAADLLVVLFTLAQTLGVDLVQLAIEKSAADVERGVR